MITYRDWFLAAALLVGAGASTSARAEGQFLWDRAFGGAGQEEAWSVVQTADGGYVLVGWGQPVVDLDAYVVRTDSLGVALWTQFYGGTREDRAYAIVPAEDGWVLTGSTVSTGAGSWDAWVFKIATDNSLQWSSTYGGTGLDDAFGLADAGDGYVVAGKTDLDGNELWTQSYGGPAFDDVAFSIIRNRLGDYVMAGRTSLAAGDYQAYLLVVGGDPTAVDPNGTGAAPGLQFLPAHPNPFNGRTRLEFVVPFAGRVQLDVYDLRGRIVGTMRGGRIERSHTAAAMFWLEAGHYVVHFDAAGLTAGLYLARLEMEGYRAVQKLVLAK
ncbi:MAG: T9SS type A sorting domain-containing protein [Gammaproteobacteria bacterium]|nr:T9SS type A sorting domain-containing protein [Gammaproteobacteria bacterium]